MAGGDGGCGARGGWVLFDNIAITVCHLPPGTSKWNRIEHRLFAFITQNWRGKPVVSHQAIVRLIANTRTEAGLTVACRIDTNA